MLSHHPVVSPQSRHTILYVLYLTLYRDEQMQVNFCLIYSTINTERCGVYVTVGAKLNSQHPEVNLSKASISKGIRNTEANSVTAFTE